MQGFYRLRSPPLPQQFDASLQPYCARTTAGVSRESLLLVPKKANSMAGVNTSILPYGEILHREGRVKLKGSVFMRPPRCSTFKTEPWLKHGASRQYSGDRSFENSSQRHVHKQTQCSSWVPYESSKHVRQLPFSRSIRILGARTQVGRFADDVSAED